MDTHGLTWAPFLVHAEFGFDEAVNEKTERHENAAHRFLWTRSTPVWIEGWQESDYLKGSNRYA